jgi:general secretion pathway protein D
LVPFFTQVTDVDTFTFDGSTTTEQSSTSVLDNLLEAVDGGSRSEEDETERTTTQGITVQLPVLAQTSVNTVVSVPDGGTVLMGGIKRMNESRTERGVPFLSNVPYVNRLFKNVGIGHETQNLMMMVTPRIIIQDEIEEDQVGKIETD